MERYTHQDMAEEEISQDQVGRIHLLSLWFVLTSERIVEGFSFRPNLDCRLSALPSFDSKDGRRSPESRQFKSLLEKD